MPWVLDDAPQAGGRWELQDAPPPPPPALDPYGQPPQGEPSDATAGYGQRGGDLAKALMQGASLGTYQAGPQSTERSGPAGTVMRGVGSMVPYGALGAGAGAIGLGGLAADIGAGAAFGGLNAAGTGYGEGKPFSPGDVGAGALIGGSIGLGGKLIGSGLGKLAPAAVETSAPARGTIEPVKNAAYKAVDNLGVAYTPEAFSGLVKKITAASVIGNLQRTADRGEPITLTQLDQKRQLIGRDASSTPADKFFGNQIRSSIDDFIQNAGEDSMASGSGPEAAAAIRNARDLNTRFAKVEALDRQAEHALDIAGGSGSGANVDNNTRQAMRRVQDSRGGWTPDETALLQQGIRGGMGQNILRQVGKVAPSGLIGAGELLSGAGLGLTHGLPGAAIPAAIAGVGMASKAAADAVTKANQRNLMATILRGGTRAPVTPPVDLSPLAAALTSYSTSGRR